MRFGLLLGTSGPVLPIDPLSLGLSGYWKASFAGSPWIDQTSTGNLAEATNPPGTGTDVNGLTPARFDGTNDVLISAANESSFYTTAAYGMVALINIISIATNNGDPDQPFGKEQILGSGATANGRPCGGVATSLGTNYFNFGHHDGTSWKGSQTSIDTGIWIMVAAGYDGTNISTSVNAGSVTNTAHNNASTVSGDMAIGPSNGGASFLNADILECMTRTSKFSPTELADLRYYFNYTYRLSLS